MMYFFTDNLFLGAKIIIFYGQTIYYVKFLYEGTILS